MKVNSASQLSRFTGNSSLSLLTRLGEDDFGDVDPVKKVAALLVYGARPFVCCSTSACLIATSLHEALIPTTRLQP